MSDVVERRREWARKYPTCAKLSAIGDEKRTIHDFLEWLRAERNFDVMDALDSHDGSMLVTTQEKLLLQYFEIDEKKLEEERRAMLEEQRKLNEKT